MHSLLETTEAELQTFLKSVKSLEKQIQRQCPKKSKSLPNEQEIWIILELQ